MFAAPLSSTAPANRPRLFTCRRWKTLLQLVHPLRPPDSPDPPDPPDSLFSSPSSPPPSFFPSTQSFYFAAPTTTTRALVDSSVPATPFAIDVQICFVIHRVNFSIGIMVVNVVSLRLLTAVCRFLYMLDAGFKRLSARYTICSLFFSYHALLCLWYFRLVKTPWWNCEPHICSLFYASPSWVVRISTLSGRVSILEGNFTKTMILFSPSLWQIDGNLNGNLSPRLDNCYSFMENCLSYSFMENCSTPNFPYCFEDLLARRKMLKVLMTSHILIYWQVAWCGVSSNTYCGLEWYFKDLNMKILSQDAAPQKQMASALTAEALVMKTALIAVKISGFRCLICFSDSLSHVTLLNTNSMNNELKSSLHDIRCLSKDFTSIPLALSLVRQFV